MWIIIILHLSGWTGSVASQEIINDAEYQTRDECEHAIADMKVNLTKLICARKPTP